jgi:cytochrome b
MTTPALPLRVWDAPTRLFHWLLVLAVIGLVLSANLGGHWMEWHMRLGTLVLSLLLFRLMWGLVGGHWSRFAQWSYGPRAVWDAVRGRSPLAHQIGHSPLGALSVWALMLVLSWQVGTGLFTDDEIFYAGPLSRLASHETVTWASQYHKGWGKLLLIAWIGLHLSALLFYKLVRGQALVWAMVTGDKTLPQDQIQGVPASSDHGRTWLRALLVYAVALAATRLVVGWGS